MRDLMDGYSTYRPYRMFTHQRRSLMRLEYRWIIFITVCVSLVMLVSPAVAQLAAYNQNATYGKPASENPFANIGLDQHLNEKIPLSLTFHDETGKSVQLGDYFGEKPVILSLAYYN